MSARRTISSSSTRNTRSESKLEELMKKNKVKKWTGLHIEWPANTGRKILSCRRLILGATRPQPPAEQFVFERNPFFHRVDENGLQLPYIDQFILNVSSSSIIPAKTGAGESDLQATGIDFTDYTFLKDAENRYPVKVSLWKKTQGSRVALLPNLNSADDVWRPLLRDVRVRRALSLAIDRHEINMAVFYGLAKESADTVLPESPLYRPEFANAWIDHDPDKANALLDEAGLDIRDDDGIRLLPDGRSGTDNRRNGRRKHARDRRAGIGDRSLARSSASPCSSVPRNATYFAAARMGGQIMMSIWSGIDNGVPTADMNPGQLAPTADDQLQWPLWGMHYVSRWHRWARRRIFLKRSN